MKNSISQFIANYFRYIKKTYSSFKTTRARAGFIAGMAFGYLIYGLIGYGLFKLVF